MAHFNFVISQNAKCGHAGFYIDCHRMTVPENILLQKSTASAKCEIFLPPLYRLFYGVSSMRRHLLATVMQFSEYSIFIFKKS